MDVFCLSGYKLMFLSGTFFLGTSAQQLDATFSTNALLEIFELDLAEPTLAMKSCGAFSSPHRCVFHFMLLLVCHVLGK